MTYGAITPRVGPGENECVSFMVSHYIHRALNYGMVGLVVGHEIMHAFDDSGLAVYTYIHL